MYTTVGFDDEDMYMSKCWMAKMSAKHSFSIVE